MTDEPEPIPEPIRKPIRRPIPEPPDREQGGDAACWAHRVCPECGRLNEAEHPVRCEICGAEFDRT